MVRNVAKWGLAGVLVALLAAGDVAARADDAVRPVVGGLVAPQGMFPWAVRLSMGCGGTLIEPRVVLTAGHCVDGTGRTDAITVVAGVADLTATGAVTARSERVIRAVGFQDETRGDDWAVIRLDRRLDLPTIKLVKGNVDTGRFVVMGWGQLREDSLQQEQRLHYAEVPTMPDVSCSTAYKKAGVNLVAEDSICAGTPAADTCQGDSGGPMVGRDARGRWVQVGIVSWGLGCARSGYPGVYTQISTFRSDIRAAARKLR